MSARTHNRARIFFAGSAAVVILGHLTLLAAGLTVTRLWEDEAYNLTVGLNLVGGNGYASDGILSAGRLDPFDYRISTGPAVLLPVSLALATGIDPVIGARTVMACFYLLLLAVLYLLGHRAAGRWGGLLAAAMPLTFNTMQQPSPLQGPTDILWEVPAALFLGTFLLLFRRHPAWAGLAIGLAFESKMLAVLVVPVAVLATVFVPRGASPGARVRRVLTFSASALGPVLLFELAKLVSLGSDRYVASTRDLFYFLRSGGQSGFSVSPWEKVLTVFSSWSLPWAVAALVVAVWGAVVVLAKARRAADRGSAVGGDLLVPLGFLAVWLMWWGISTTQPAWIRHPSPALLVAVPVLAAHGLAAWNQLRAGHPDRWPALPVAVGGISVGLFLFSAGAHLWTVYTPRETLQAQRAVAATIRTIPGAELRGWWGSFAPIALLADKRAVLVENDPVSSSPILVNGGADAGPDVARARAEVWCGDALVHVASYLVCAPKVVGR